MFVSGVSAALRPIPRLEADPLNLTALRLGASAVIELGGPGIGMRRNLLGDFQRAAGLEEPTGASNHYPIVAKFKL